METSSCQGLGLGRASHSCELNFITPLGHVINSLTLVDLVDQVLGMVDHAHRRLPRDSRTAEPIYVGDAEAVETEVRELQLDEELLPPSGRLKREIHGELAALSGQAFEERPHGDPGRRSSPRLGNRKMVSSPRTQKSMECMGMRVFRLDAAAGLEGG